MKDNVFSSCVFFRLHQNSCKTTVCLGQREIQKWPVCVLTMAYTGRHIHYSNAVRQQPARRNWRIPSRALDTFLTQKKCGFQEVTFQWL